MNAKVNHKETGETHTYVPGEHIHVNLTQTMIN
jgi:hypothetical protein